MLACGGALPDGRLARQHSGSLEEVPGGLVGAAGGGARPKAIATREGPENCGKPMVPHSGRNGHFSGQRMAQRRRAC